MAMSRWNGEEVEVERECDVPTFVCVPFNPFPLTLRSMESENIPSKRFAFGSCVIVGRVPFTNSLFSLQLFLYFLSFALFADCKKTRGKIFVLETFVGEKGGRTRKTNFILYFILLKKQETPERVKPLNRQDVRVFRQWRVFTLVKKIIIEKKKVFFEKNERRANENQKKKIYLSWVGKKKCFQQQKKLNYIN